MSVQKPSTQISPSVQSIGVLNCRSHIFRVGVGEALELILVQVHDEEFVCGCQLHWHLCELLVKVANVLA